MFDALCGAVLKIKTSQHNKAILQKFVLINF